MSVAVLNILWPIHSVLRWDTSAYVVMFMIMKILSDSQGP